MSHIQIDSKIVFDACTAKRKKIEEIRERKVEALIQYQMTQTKGWFSKKTYNRDEAIYALENEDPFGTEIFFAGQYAWGDYDKCYQLIQLSLLGDPITITTEHIHLFDDYIEEITK